MSTEAETAARKSVPPSCRIPVSKPPYLTASEEAVLRALREGTLGGYGPPNEAVERLLTNAYGRPVLLLSSGTHALELSAMLLRIEPGDEVIVPSFGFVTTANAFALHGAQLRFADCDLHGNLDADSVERSLSPRTRAVVPIHYAGACGDVPRLVELCEKHGAVLIEDAAQAIGATFAGQPLGTLGAVGCLSFDSMKNVTAGQGGAVIVSDEKLLSDAHRIRDRGTNQRDFHLGRVDEYWWTGHGSNFSLSDLNAALLLPQLEKLDVINGRRERLWERYHSALAGPVRTVGAYSVEVAPAVRSSHHIFAIVWSDRTERDAFVDTMAEAGIQTPFHYPALHRSPFGRQFAVRGEEFPNSERLADGLTRLPLYDSLTDDEQSEVIERTLAFVEQRSQQARIAIDRRRAATRTQS